MCMVAPLSWCNDDGQKVLLPKNDKTKSMVYTAEPWSNLWPFCDLLRPISNLIYNLFFYHFNFKINKWVSDPVIFNGGPTGLENLWIIACAWNTVHKICDLTWWIYAGFMTNLWPISFLPNWWPFYDFSRMNIKFTGLFLIYDHRIHHEITSK